MVNTGLSETFWDPPKSQKSTWSWCPRGEVAQIFSELYSNPQSGGFQRGEEVSFLRSMTSLEVVKIVIFLWKINDFEGSAINVSLPFTPSFGPSMRYQKPFKMSPTSTSEGYQIRLLFSKAFKIASKTDFCSKITSQSSSKSVPNRL